MRPILMLLALTLSAVCAHASDLDGTDSVQDTVEAIRQAQQDDIDRLEAQAWIRKGQIEAARRQAGRAPRYQQPARRVDEPSHTTTVLDEPSGCAEAWHHDFWGRKTDKVRVCY